MKVTKMQGCGNDFVILDYDAFLKLNLEMPEAAKKLCDRHFGIGADGLIIPNTNTQDADIGWFFYNSDGSTAQMCGNGMRCFAKYVYDKGLVKEKEFTVKTLAGIMKPQILDDGTVRVNMSKPILETEKIPFLPNHNLNYKVSVKNMIFEGNAVSMGNPHFVIFVAPEDDVMEFAKEYGPIIETGAEFHEKTNVEFVNTKSYKKIELAVWERGCGITLACGTGASASVVAAIYNNVFTRDQEIKVILKGGELYITLTSDNHVFMRGSATEVFTGEYKLKKL